MDRNAMARRAEHDIVRLCHAGLDASSLWTQTLRRLRTVIPADALFCATVDPATVLFTSTISEAIPEDATSAFLTNEFLQDDVNKFLGLAQSDRPVQSLYAVTKGEPARSLRYREIMHPLGFGDELRAALRIGSVTWGVMCIHREHASTGFTTTESAFLERVAPHLAVGLRKALLVRPTPENPRPDGPGLVLLAEDLSVAAVTAPAEEWLAEVGDWPRQRVPPQSVLAVAGRLMALEQGGDEVSSLMPRVRVQTQSGRWLVLHASRLTGVKGGGPIAVILEPAAPVEVAPLVLQAHGLTDRETHVAHQVLQGRSTNEIAASLSISALTVQQHLKAIFDKTGTRSRRELVAQVFTQQYLPRIAGSAGAPSAAGTAGR
jgi:DNA-binding CsgD family transcriptional regulator